jgi:hypothetical protein
MGMDSTQLTDGMQTGARDALTVRHGTRGGVDAVQDDEA